MESPKFCEIKVAVCFTKNGIAKVAGYIYIYTTIYINLDMSIFMCVCIVCLNPDKLSFGKAKAIITDNAGSPKPPTLRGLLVHLYGSKPVTP